MSRIKQALQAASERMLAVLPKHLTPERMVQVVTTMAYRTPKLQDCEPLSVVSSVLQAAELGLDLAPSLGEAYLIPRWNKRAGILECQMMPGYRGLCKLARNSGEVETIFANPVYEGDLLEWEYVNGVLECRHCPRLDGARGAIRFVYGVSRLSNGRVVGELMTVEEIEAVRARSSYRDEGPWVTDWTEMAKKTAIKRLTKILPRSLELARAMELDDAEYQDGPRSVVSAPPSRAAMLTRRLRTERGLPAPLVPAPSGEPGSDPDEDAPLPEERLPEATEESKRSSSSREPGED